MHLSSGQWTLLFGAVQTVGVVVAVAFGISQLRDLATNRSLTSLETMLEQWRRSSAERDLVLRLPPVALGQSLEERCLALAQQIREIDAHGNATQKEELRTLCRVSRSVVHELNDIGAFVERGGVRQWHFFGHFHVRLIELVYALEPFLMLTSAARGSRWGIRLRAMRDGALSYHRSHPTHAGIDLVLHGQLLATGQVPPHRLTARLKAWRAEHRRYLRQTPARAREDLDAIHSVQRTVGSEIGLGEVLELLMRYSETSV